MPQTLTTMPDTDLQRPAEADPSPGHTADGDPLHGPFDTVAELLGAVVGLASEGDAEAVYSRIADLIHQLIDYDLFGVMLWNGAEKHLESVFVRRTPGSSSEKLTLSLGEGLCGVAGAERRAVRVGDVRLDRRYVSCGDTRVRSELVVPMVFEGRLLGLLDLESHRPDAFTAAHERLLTTLAANVAVALENVQLLARLQRDEKCLARDLQTARGIQRSLLPRTTPWTPGLRLGVANAAAQELGGDVYDFFGYGGERTAVAVGDVAGKGTAAALYGSMTIGLLRGYIADNRCDPRCVLTYLNDELRQLEVERRFLAFSFAVYHREHRRLLLSNAGLPYPWLVRDGRAREIELGGVPLGAMARPVHGQLELDLLPGDRVVFATDGIEECLGCPIRFAGQPFGSDGVQRTLEATADRPPQEMAQALLDATQVHLGTRLQASDDRTVLALQVTG
ncbi:MAG: SpoIIE family protein phosphatase [Acidobacteriota bacterium]